MTPADLAALREKAEKTLDETHGQTCPFCTLARDILSLLSTLEAEQQQRARLEQERERLRTALTEMRRLANLPMPVGTITEPVLPADSDHAHGWRMGMGRACDLMRAALLGDAP